MFTLEMLCFIGGDYLVHWSKKIQHRKTCTVTQILQNILTKEINDYNLSILLTFFVGQTNNRTLNNSFGSSQHALQHTDKNTVLMFAGFMLLLLLLSMLVVCCI